jgi:hypothetical protein
MLNRVLIKKDLFISEGRYENTQKLKHFINKKPLRLMPERCAYYRRTWLC